MSKASSPSHLDISATMSTHYENKKIPPPPPGQFFQPPRRSFSLKGLQEQEDPFLAALKECTKSVRDVKMSGESSKSWIGSKIPKSMFTCSCKHSCDVEDDNLVRLTNLPPLPKTKYRGFIKK
ncbi:unnamed protein product [Ilex paraguariensis]|uniref:Uncharacterized protein n=1 Tax=Ilex paraguariensis TaxID=185542 RepID=A0ABC8RNT3_9AQUA